MKNIIFIAPPAAGKGTQSNTLQEKYGYTHISTGDLLRNVSEDTDLGKKIREIMNNGDLVSDELVTELLKEKLENTTGNFILDGYPRNVIQAKILDELLSSINRNDYIVIYLNIKEELAMRRALSRITCSDCGHIYNRYTPGMQPKIEGICDKCGGKIIARDDDTEEAFKKRFQNYIENTEPVIDYYKNKNILKIVDVCDDKNQTFEKILKILEED